MQKEKRWISSKVLFSAISEQLAENRQAVFTVTGMSMWPFLCHGRDQVIVERAEKKRVKTGDIILFQVTEEIYILHRIVELDEEFFQTAGDGNLFLDMRMPYDSMVAKVSEVIRKGKRIDCSSRTWRVLSWIWIRLFPVRKWLFHIWSFVRGKELIAQAASAASGEQQWEGEDSKSSKKWNRI